MKQNETYCTRFLQLLCARSISPIIGDMLLFVLNILILLLVCITITLDHKCELV